MADTPENQREYPQSSSQKPGCGFPIARILVLFCLSTAMVLEMYLAPMTYSEHRLFIQMHSQLVAGDVLLGDRGFCSYTQIALLFRRGVDSVFRANASKDIDFRKGLRLGRYDHIVYWYKPSVRSELLTPAQWALLPDFLELREVRIFVNIPGFRTKVITVITTLLDANIYTKQALADLYYRRWEAELYLRDIKITMKMEFINSKTPHMVRNQVWMHILAYNLIRRLMWQAGELYHVPPLLISLKGTIDTLDVYLPHLAHASPRLFPQLYLDFLLEIAEDLISSPRHRYQPRVIKRRKKPKFGLLMAPRSEYRARLAR